MVNQAQTGILLVNLGTPATPDVAGVRPYLAEFLSDPRVVELPRWLWLPLLHGIILRTRPRRSAKLYQKIWQADGSPILIYSRSIVKQLQARWPDCRVELAMRYGQPDLPSAIENLLASGIERLLVLPMFPQFAACTTATIFDRIADIFRRKRNLPELIFVRSYHRHPRYLDALAKHIEHYWQHHGRADKLLMSFHGIPQAMADNGDPYPEECRFTAEQVAHALGLEQDQWQAAFQSRFGPAQWLTPYTDVTLKAWAQSGVKTVDVVCPGFSVDCLETLEEIAQENAELFRSHGGESLRYIPALNDSPSQIDIFDALIRERLQVSASE